jgi:hypothetical protein
LHATNCLAFKSLTKTDQDRRLKKASWGPDGKENNDTFGPPVFFGCIRAIAAFTVSSFSLKWRVPRPPPADLRLSPQGRGPVLVKIR